MIRSLQYGRLDYVEYSDVTVQRQLATGAKVILKARLAGADNVEFLLTNSDSRESGFFAATIPPSAVQRSTGTFRNPEFLVDLTPSFVSMLFDVPDPAVGQVVGLIVHTMSRRAAAVGVFADAAAARAWWHQPYNRLARDPDVLFLPVLVEADA